MVATRRGTRVEPRDGGEGSAAEQVDVISSNSPMHTRRSVRKDGQTSESGADEVESVVTRSRPLKSDPETHSPHITTRNRSRNETSDAEVSEAKSSPSRTSTRSHGKPSLGQLTDSTRKLRSRQSASITKSKEDAELSEAESHCSSVSTAARRRQPRPTRSRKSLLLSEPASDISDAESTTSSVSGVKVIATRSTRNSRARHPPSLTSEPPKEQTSDAESTTSSVSGVKVIAARSTRNSRARHPPSLTSEPPKEQTSDAESTTSSVSGVKVIATRSTRNSRARHPSSLTSEPPKEQTSDAESCSSGFSLQPLARRFSRRNKANLESDEVEFVSETYKDEAQGHETWKKQSPEIHGVKSDAPSFVGEQKVLSSPRRSLRPQPPIPEEEAIVISDHIDEPESSDTVCKVSVLEPEVEESSGTKEVDLPVEGSAMSLQSRETPPEENLIPDPMLSEDRMEEPLEIKTHITNDDDTTKERNGNLQGVKESEHMAESMNICLYIDSESDQSGGEDHDDADDHDADDHDVADDHDADDHDDADDSDDDDDDDKEEDNIMEVEEEDEVQVVEKPKSKKASTAQVQDVAGDGLFVIDTDPGVDANKKYFLEPQQVVKKHKSKKASKQKLQDVAGDGLFVIDTDPGVDTNKKYFLEPEDKEDKIEAGKKREMPELEEEDDFIDEDDDDVDEEETLLHGTQSAFVMSTSIDTGIKLKEMGGLYINFDAAKRNPGPSLLSKMKGINKKDELLQKSIITPDFEKKESVPPYSQSKQKLKKLRKEERDGTSGSGWFNMKAPQLTSELKNDLKALKMRSAMDPKHFYKKNDREGFPKYFQVGTVVDNPVDFYHSRVPKKQRKRTIVDELLADSEFRRYNKKKYMEIVAEKAARAAGKKHRKKKKFKK